MLLGLQVPDFTWPDSPVGIGPVFRRIARDADQAGLASLWVMDHFFQIAVIGPPENEMLEGWSALAHAAAVTERITLGTLVTGVTYRHPGVLVKTATTLDVLSGGRAWFGIGAAWNEPEHRGLGIPYPPLAERFERLEETLRLAHQMWRGDDSPFPGTHVRAERPLNSPRPVSQPHPRVLVGGGGEKKTLRLVARYADACNLFEFGLGPQGVRAKLDVLQQHCADEGRDYGEIHRTTLGVLSLSADGADGGQTVDAAVDRFAALATVGVDQAIVSIPGIADPRRFELVPELVRRMAEIPTAGR